MKLYSCKFVFALTVAISITTTITAQEPAPPLQPAATIIGTVQDQEEGIIPGASVVLEGSAKSDERKLVSQDDGSFKLEDVKPGVPYHVHFTADGFAD